MSITYTIQDVTTITHGIIGHGVNCLGRMGSGIALAIRNQWSQVYTEYKGYCDVFDGPSKEMLGICQIVDIDNELKIANCFTQAQYGNDGVKYANIDSVKESLEGLFAYAEHTKLPIFLPRIGCGLGGLDWYSDVEPIIQDLSVEFPNISVTICDI